MSWPTRARQWPPLVLIIALLAAGCAPASPPAPTAAPAKDVATAAPAGQTSPPGAISAAPVATVGQAKPAPTAAATAQPLAKPAGQAIEEFYRGKTLKVVVGFGAGGAFDVVARLVARNIGKHIPGNPTAIVENQPGAGSLLAANSVYNVAPKDGTTMVYFLGGHIVQQVLENPAVQFDATQFNWLGAPYRDTPACAVTRAGGFNTLMEATGDRELILGGTASGSNDTDIPVLLKNLLGLNIKMVTGYDGLTKVWLAAQQGEVMGGCQAWEGMKLSLANELANGDVKVIAQGGRTAHPDLPSVPIMRDLARDDEQRQLIDTSITLSSVYNRPFALPPGVPAERVQVMRDAFQATLSDPALLEEARQLQLEMNPITSTELEQAVQQIFSLSPDLRAKLKAALAL